jgi:ParB/RepB/Spo0J family partition protein
LDKSRYTLSEMKEEQHGIQELEVSEIGERYRAYRIVNPRADVAMVKSIRKYGQLSPVVCVKGEKGYEMIDGFKRLRASRSLNQTRLRATTIEVRGRGCKAAMLQLNQSGRSMGEMEEALILQSLYREDGLMQTEIAVLVGRDKSWVSRRISLMERLSEEVQEYIRLGLISVITGRDLTVLPRGNQKDALACIHKHRLSSRETAQLVSRLLQSPRWEHENILHLPLDILDRRCGPRTAPHTPGAAQVYRCLNVLLEKTGAAIETVRAHGCFFDAANRSGMIAIIDKSVSLLLQLKAALEQQALPSTIVGNHAC